MEYQDFIGRVEQMEGVGGLSEVQREQFRAMEGLYREWNAKINVISRQDIDELYCHHVLHSLAIAEYMREEMPQEYDRAREQDGEMSFLDVGTGGGFPGIPLAIMFPAAQFTLCDSVAKKVRVAADIAERLGLRNVTTVTARAETLTGKYDYVVSRAVSQLDNFIPWVKDKYTKGILCLKGGDVAAEISLAIGRLRLNPAAVHLWSIEEWLDDEYFQEKFVIFIENFCK